MGVEPRGSPGKHARKWRRERAAAVGGRMPRAGAAAHPCAAQGYMCSPGAPGVGCRWLHIDARVCWRWLEGSCKQSGCARSHCLSPGLRDRRRRKRKPTPSTLRGTQRSLTKGLGGFCAPDLPGWMPPPHAFALPVTALVVENSQRPSVALDAEKDLNFWSAVSPLELAARSSSGGGVGDGARAIAGWLFFGERVTEADLAGAAPQAAAPPPAATRFSGEPWAVRAAELVRASVRVFAAADFAGAARDVPRRYQLGGGGKRAAGGGRGGGGAFSPAGAGSLKQTAGTADTPLAEAAGPTPPSGGCGPPATEAREKLATAAAAIAQPASKKQAAAAPAAASTSARAGEAPPSDGCDTPAPGARGKPATAAATSGQPSDEASDGLLSDARPPGSPTAPPLGWARETRAREESPAASPVGTPRYAPPPAGLAENENAGLLAAKACPTVYVMRFLSRVLPGLVEGWFGVLGSRQFEHNVGTLHDYLAQVAQGTTSDVVPSAPYVLKLKPSGLPWLPRVTDCPHQQALGKRLLGRVFHFFAAHVAAPLARRFFPGQRRDTNMVAHYHHTVWRPLWKLFLRETPGYATAFPYVPVPLPLEITRLCAILSEADAPVAENLPALHLSLQRVTNQANLDGTLHHHARGILRALSAKGAGFTAGDARAALQKILQGALHLDGAASPPVQLAFRSGHVLGVQPEAPADVPQRSSEQDFYSAAGGCAREQGGVLPSSCAGGGPQTLCEGALASGEKLAGRKRVRDGADDRGGPPQRSANASPHGSCDGASASAGRFTRQKRARDEPDDTAGLPQRSADASPHESCDGGSASANRFTRTKRLRTERNSMAVPPSCDGPQHSADAKTHNSFTSSQDSCGWVESLVGTKRGREAYQVAGHPTCTEDGEPYPSADESSKEASTILDRSRSTRLPRGEVASGAAAEEAAPPLKKKKKMVDTSQGHADDDTSCSDDLRQREPLSRERSVPPSLSVSYTNVSSDPSSALPTPQPGHHPFIEFPRTLSSTADPTQRHRQGPGPMQLHVKKSATPRWARVIWKCGVSSICVRLADPSPTPSPDTLGPGAPCRPAFKRWNHLRARLVTQRVDFRRPTHGAVGSALNKLKPWIKKFAKDRRATICLPGARPALDQHVVAEVPLDFNSRAVELMRGCTAYQMIDTKLSLGDGLRMLKSCLPAVAAEGGFFLGHTDASQAYDAITHPAAEEVVRELGCGNAERTAELVRLLKGVLGSRTTGVPQGWVLSEVVCDRVQQARVRSAARFGEASTFPPFFCRLADDVLVITTTQTHLDILLAALTRPDYLRGIIPNVLKQTTATPFLPHSKVVFNGLCITPQLEVFPDVFKYARLPLWKRVSAFALPHVPSYHESRHEIAEALRKGEPVPPSFAELALVENRQRRETRQAAGASNPKNRLVDVALMFAKANLTRLAFDSALNSLPRLYRSVHAVFCVGWMAFFAAAGKLLHRPESSGAACIAAAERAVLRLEALVASVAGQGIVARLDVTRKARKAPKPGGERPAAAFAGCLAHLHAHARAAVAHAALAAAPVGHHFHGVAAALQTLFSAPQPRACVCRPCLFAAKRSGWDLLVRAGLENWAAPQGGFRDEFVRRASTAATPQTEAVTTGIPSDRRIRGPALPRKHTAAQLRLGAMDVGDLRRGGRSDLRLLPSYCPHIPVIKYLLFSLSRRGDVIKDSGGTAPGEAYNGVKPPAISLEDYLYRWVRYSFCSSETFVLAVILIDRLAYRTGLLITSINVHRLLLVALVLAAKFRDDVYYSNKYYASVGGVTAAEMNALEISALADLDWE
eukprot:gene8893-13793_t